MSFKSDFCKNIAMKKTKLSAFSLTPRTICLQSFDDCYHVCEEICSEYLTLNLASLFKQRLQEDNRNGEREPCEIAQCICTHLSAMASRTH